MVEFIPFGLLEDCKEKTAENVITGERFTYCDMWDFLKHTHLEKHRYYLFEKGMTIKAWKLIKDDKE